MVLRSAHPSRFHIPVHIERAAHRSAPIFFILASVAFLFSIAAQADDGHADPWREVWSGADISQHVWLAYAGGTLSPFVGIHDQGVKLRAVTGYGQYDYESVAPIDSPRGRTASFSVDTQFAEALVGYLWRFDALTVKAFVGFSAIRHDVAPFDTQTLVIGEDYGLKGVVELWLNMGPNAWSSLDVAWSQAFDTRSVRFRAGYRVWQPISVGVEGGLNVDAQGECKMGHGSHNYCGTGNADTSGRLGLLDFGRAGLFARYAWETGEVSLSTGALGQVFNPEGTIDYEPYVTVNWITQF